MPAFRRVLVVALIWSCSLLILAGPIEAHTFRTIGPKVCQRNWRTVAGNESQIKCMANYFGVPADYAASVARCESGFRYNAVSPSGTYRGTWQMGPMFENNRPHMLPKLPKASPFQGRHATIFVMRYAKHYGWSAWACS